MPLSVNIKMFADQTLSCMIGKRAMMISPLEFYAAITPDCGLVHGVGSGVHVELTQQEVEHGQVVSEQKQTPGSSPLSASNFIY